MALPHAAKPALLRTHVQHRARGLCPMDYAKVAGTDALLDHARRQRTLAEFVEEYDVLGPRGEGLTQMAIAARLGVTEEAVRSALKRARERNLV
jgi:hypothetical protein